MRQPSMHPGLPIAALLCAVALLSGCVVSTSANTGILEVRWANDGNDCAGLTGVRVRVERGGDVYAQSGTLPCSKGFQSFSLEQGTYDIFVQGVAGTGSVVRSGSMQGQFVEADVNTLSPIIEMFATSTGMGSLRVKWTAAGMSAVTGCAQLGLDTVTASVFNSNFTAVLAQEAAQCEAGEVVIDDIPPGQVWLQLDGRDAQDHAFWGNIKAHGPLDIYADTVATPTTAQDVVDLRATINIPWQFANGKTCGGNGVGTVKVEISRPTGTVLVPMSDADATKPCDISAATPLANKAIDLQFTTPTCAIPANADGLILCGILEPNLDVRAVAVSEQGVVTFGGWLKIRSLTLGTFTPNTKPLYLESCGTLGIDCAVK